MRCLLGLTMCSPLQTKQKCKDNNKASEKQTEDVDNVEITTNRVRDKLSKNVKTITTTTSSENVETIIRVIPDKITQLRLLKFRPAMIVSPDLLNSFVFHC